MAWRVARSLNVLLGQLNALAPHRSRASDGSIGDAAHAARRSDHNPAVRFPGDARGIVTARDFTHAPAGGLDCQRLADALERNRDPRIKYVIWNRRIMAGVGGPEPWHWRPYRGRNPHTRHLHLSVLADPISDDNRAWLLDGVAAGGTAVVPTEFQPDGETSFAWVSEDDELDLLLEALDDEGIGNFLGKVLGGAASGAAAGAPAGPWGALIGAGVGAGMSALGAAQSPKSPRPPKGRPGTRPRRSTVTDVQAAQIAQLLPLLNQIARGRGMPLAESDDEEWDYEDFEDFGDYSDYDYDDLDDYPESEEEAEAVRAHRSRRPRHHHVAPARFRWTGAGWRPVYRRAHFPRTRYPGWRWTPTGWHRVHRVRIPDHRFRVPRPLPPVAPPPFPPPSFPPSSFQPPSFQPPSFPPSSFQPTGFPPAAPAGGVSDQIAQLIPLLSQIAQGQTAAPPPEEPVMAAPPEEPAVVDPAPEPSPAEPDEDDDAYYADDDEETLDEDDDEYEGC